MEISIKQTCEYKIECTLHESDLMKIEKILQDTPYHKTEAVWLGDGYYMLKLDTTQLSYILNYLLKKEGEK